MSDCESDINTAISNSENTHKKLSLYPIAGVDVECKGSGIHFRPFRKVCDTKYVRVLSGHFIDRSDLSRCRACVVRT